MTASGPILRVIALGRFSSEPPPLAPHLAELPVVALRCPSLEQLPGPLDDHVVLLTELAWLGELAPSQREELASRARRAAAWVALCADDASFEEQIAWQRAGVGHYLPSRIDSGRLAALIEDIHDRLEGPPLRVILVDDEAGALAYHGELLRQAGMVVAAMADPRLALAASAEFKPDLLLVDIEMPGCSGPELVAILRQRPEYEHLPALYLAATEGMDDLPRARRGAAEDFLAKPVPGERLIAAVQAQAWRHRARLRAEAMHLNQEARARFRLEQLLLALDEHAIVSVTDAHGNILKVNDRFCAISGYRREELLGQNQRIVKSGEHGPDFYAEMWGAFKAGRIWHGELCNRRKDGGSYWVESTIMPVLHGGRPIQYISILTDITRLKKNERALRLLVSGTVATVGDEFFRASAAGLARALGVRIGFIAERAGQSPTAIRTIARWDTDHIGENLSYDARHTPCEQVLTEGFAFHPAKVAAAFPLDAWLGEHGIESYVGIVLCDSHGGFLGHMGIMDDKPLAGDDASVALLKIFAARVAAEMERRRAERELERHKERLRRGQAFANIGTWDWDIQSGELYWSERIAPLFGYREGELETSYENFLKAVHPDDRQAVIDAVNAAVRDDAPYDIEHRVVWPDGTVRWLLERGAVARDVAGQPLHMLGVVQDIDDRKQTEERLALFRRIFDASTQCIGVADGQGRLVYQNQAHARAYGYTDAEVIGRNIDLFMPKETTPSLFEEISRVMAEGRNWTGQLPLRRKDGGIFISASNIGFVRDEKGQVQYIFNLFSDFSAELARREELAQAKETAERASRAKSEFLSSMSHELRTPMNAIIGFAQMLEYDEQLNADQLDNVHEILKGGRHLLELINEVLDLAKIESGRVELSLEAVALAVLAEDCRQLIQPLAARRGIALRFEVAADTAVRADRVRLKQVLLNLLSNAVKYNRENGWIRFGVRAVTARRLRIEIADCGPGIPAERIEEIFQPFNRLDAEFSEIEGTGIGLTITRRLVEMMDGGVGVDSVPGTGSTFWIELPASAPAAPAAHAAAPREPRDGNGAAMHLVLSIDDNPVNLKLIAQILGMRQHVRLITAHTPELGIELALAHRPALILLDINMPGMNGYQLMEVIKADPVLKAIPVVAVTANAMPRDIERGIAAGFAAYITKPLAVDSFLQTVDHHLALAAQGHG
jgi:PAS domain S-box-containing protein